MSDTFSPFAYTPNVDLRTTNISGIANDYYSQLAKNWLPTIANNQYLDWNTDWFKTSGDIGLGGRGTGQGFLPTSDISPLFENDYTGAVRLNDKVNFFNGDSYSLKPEYSSKGYSIDYLGDFPRIIKDYSNDEILANFLAKDVSGGSGTENAASILDPFWINNIVSDNDGGGRWYTDTINDPNYQKYLDDPNIVKRDQNGNVTSIRGDIAKTIFIDYLGNAGGDINRASTDAASGIGIGAILSLAGMAFGIPVLSTFGNVANVGQAISDGNVLGALGSFAGLSGIGDVIGDATQLGAQGLDAAQIADALGYSNAGGTLNTLTSNYGSVMGDVANGLSNVVPSIGDLSSDYLANTMVNSGAVGGLTGAINGNIGQGVLAGVAAPLVGAGVNQGANALFGTTDANGNAISANQNAKDTLGSIGSSALSGAQGGLTNAIINSVVGNDVDFGNALTSGALGGVTKNLMGQGLSAANGAIKDAFKDWGPDATPTDAQLQELQLTNPDAYDWYMFGDQMGNTDQTDYSFMTNPNDTFNDPEFNDNTIGQFANTEQTGYTGTEQGDTNMDDLEWQQALDFFDSTGGSDPYNNYGSDYVYGNGTDINDEFNDNTLSQFLNGTYTVGSANDGSLTGGNVNASGNLSSGILGSIKDAVNSLLGGGSTGSSNSALLYTLLEALLKSKQTSAGNQMSQDAVNMVVNAGEKGSPTRLNTNFGAPKTAVGTLQQLAAPITNGVFQLGLTRK